MNLTVVSLFVLVVLVAVTTSAVVFGGRHASMAEARREGFAGGGGGGVEKRYAMFLKSRGRQELEHVFDRDGKVYVLAMGGGASGQSRENQRGGGAGHIESFQTSVKRGDVMKMRVGRGGERISYGFHPEKTHADGGDTTVRIVSPSSRDLVSIIAKGARGSDGSSGGGNSSKSRRAAYDGGEKGADGGRKRGSSVSGRGMGVDAFSKALAPLSDFNPYGIRAGRKGLAETTGYYRCGGGGGGLAVTDLDYERAEMHPSRGDAMAAKPGEGLGAAGSGAGYADGKKRGGGRGAQGFVYFHHLD